MAISFPPTLWETDQITILANQTTDISSIKTADYVSAKYILSFNDDPLSRFKSFEMSVARKSSDVITSIYNKQGDIKLNCDAILDGEYTYIRVGNQEDFDINVSVTRLVQ